MHLYGTITKVDKKNRVVSGYASTEAVDSAGEVVLKTAVEAALGDYLEWGNIREMHSLSAVGKTVEASTDSKGLWIVAQIVDEAAWKKVEAGVYSGFSIGGRTLERSAKNRRVITKIQLTEISLVDRPANPECRLDIMKASAGGAVGGVRFANPKGDAEVLALIKTILGEMSAPDRAMVLTKAALKIPTQHRATARRF